MTAATLYRVDPVSDSRWDRFIDTHPRASVFHTRGWLQALRDTYGYLPIAFSTSDAQQELRNAIVFCEIRSWLTGRRLVSLPFSDHCDPLVDHSEWPAMCDALRTGLQSTNGRYLEVRPQSVDLLAGFGKSEEFFLHLLNLRIGEAELFSHLHKHAIQQPLRRAEREGLVCQEGRDEKDLRAFYRLLMLTRQRHALPPQPFAWFRNLATFLGRALTVRLALHRGQPVAGILTLRHRDTVVYKYAASDAEFHNLGGMQLLLWTAIRQACASGCSTFDLGRSDRRNTGLITFKDRWGATRSALTYWRFPKPRPLSVKSDSWVRRCTGEALRHAPDGVRIAAGRLLYKHVG